MKNKSILYLSALCGCLLLLNSCKKEYDSIQSIDDQKIQAYISKNSLNMTKDPTGYYYQIVSQGTGGPVENKDSVFVSYDYKSLSGQVFYSTPQFTNVGTFLGYLSSVYNKSTTDLSLIYPADIFRTVIAKAPRGSKIKVIIPSYLAFGKNGNGNVGVNEVIVSDINVFTQKSQVEVDAKNITTFLTEKGLTATKNSAGIYTMITTPGTGTDVSTRTSTVTVKYVGKLLNGTIFDQTVGTATFDATLAGGVIPGFQKGLVGYTSGTKLRLFIPSGLAYGTVGSAAIPANSVLDFEIEITKVTN